MHVGREAVGRWVGGLPAGRGTKSAFIQRVWAVSRQALGSPEALHPHNPSVYVTPLFGRVPGPDADCGYNDNDDDDVVVVVVVVGILWWWCC